MQTLLFSFESLLYQQPHIFVRPFQRRSLHATVTVMRLMKVIHRLLFVTALLGIVVGPMSIGAVNSVMAASGPVVIDGMAGMDMPDDMPCCPDQKPIKPDCGSKSCPLALLCTTAVVGQLALPSPGR